MSIAKGQHIEKQAQDYLSQQGLQLVKANFRTSCGEIDLIMRDKGTMVFIEVRSRASLQYGSALESITLSKQKKIIKTALYYLSTHSLLNKGPSRFDVLIAQGPKFQFEWIKNAFGV